MENNKFQKIVLINCYVDKYISILFKTPPKIFPGIFTPKATIDEYINNNGSLTVNNLGRIIATGCIFDRLPDMGYRWSSIGLGGDNGSSFTNCTFMNGGMDTNSGMVNITSGAAFAFTGCKFQNTTEYGVSITSSNATLKGSVTGSGNTFSGCTKGNVRLYNGTASATLP
jgi:hypothetical protein